MQKAAFIRAKGDGSLVDINVTTGAWKTVFLGVREDGRLKVAVAAPPKDGKANKELLSLFKAKYGESELVSGAKTRKKTVYVKNIGPKELAEKIMSGI